MPYCGAKGLDEDHHNLGADQLGHVVHSTQYKANDVAQKTNIYSLSFLNCIWIYIVWMRLERFCKGGQKSVGQLKQ